MGSLVPFNPKKHKPIKLPGGGKATEYLASETSPEGTAWNIPQIWFDSETNEPRFLKGDKAWDEAQAYEKEPEKNFQDLKLLSKQLKQQKKDLKLAAQLKQV